MKEILNTVCDIGEQMLCSGAEVHRVEDSVERMCRAIGATRADVFIITSSMIVTVYTEDERAYTQSRRIHSINTDLERLHRMNDLCRRVSAGETDLEKIRAEYDEIMALKGYPVWAQYLAYGIIGGAFAVFFGGGLAEGLVAFLVGLLLRVVVSLTDRAALGRIFCRFACSFTASLLAYLFCKIGLIPVVDHVIIGNIMVLIPGIGLTNAIRDLIVGDSIAGLLRAIEAVLIALAIAAGHFLFITLFGGLLI